MHAKAENGKVVMGVMGSASILSVEEARELADALYLAASEAERFGALDELIRNASGWEEELKKMEDPRMQIVAAHLRELCRIASKHLGAPSA